MVFNFTQVSATHDTAEGKQVDRKDGNKFMEFKEREKKTGKMF